MKTTRSMTAAYLYSDGTLVQVFEEFRNGSKIGETADLTLNYCEVNLYETYSLSHGYNKSVAGRIILPRYRGDGFLSLAKHGKIDAHMPDVEAGSQNSRSRRIAVQTVKLCTKAGIKLAWTEMPAIIHSDFTVQTGEEWAPERWEVGYKFGMAYITSIKDLKPAAKVMVA